MVELKLLLKQQEKREWSFNRMNKPNEENQEIQEPKADTVETPETDVTDNAGKLGNNGTPENESKVSDASVQDKVLDSKKENEKVAASNDNKSSPRASEAEGPETLEKVISINRITKVTKGGKKLSFSALVVVGDRQGNVGYSLSKASEVATAIRKAVGVAKKSMINVSLKGTTISHEIIGRCGGARVLLKPASDGTGVIASGPVRAVCDGVGIHNILTKCHRSNNPINVVKATIDGLSRLKTEI